MGGGVTGPARLEHGYSGATAGKGQGGDRDWARGRNQEEGSHSVCGGGEGFAAWLPTPG